MDKWIEPDSIEVTGDDIPAEVPEDGDAVEDPNPNVQNDEVPA